VSNPPKSTPKSIAAHCPQGRPTSLLVSNMAQGEHLSRAGSTNVCRESLGILVASHQQEFTSGAQWIFGSNCGIPNQQWPLPGEVSGSWSLGYT